MRAALFDIDGLFVDSETLDFKVFLEKLESLGINMTMNEIRKFTGVQNEFVYRSLRDQHGLDFDVKAVLDEHYKTFEKRMHTVQVLPGAREIVRRCRNLGYKTGIVSGNRPHIIQKYLERIGVDGFDVIISSNDCPSKPDPAGYLMAAERLSAPSRSCIVFEDAEHGVEAAKAAGMYVVGVRAGSYGKQNLSRADYIAATLRQVETPLLMRFPNLQQLAQISAQP